MIIVFWKYHMLIVQKKFFYCFLTWELLAQINSVNWTAQLHKSRRYFIFEEENSGGREELERLDSVGGRETYIRLDILGVHWGSWKVSLVDKGPTAVYRF